ncbi:hypothetical protein LHK12_19600 [Providencia rettgeri]|nr:hypothetical protein [Providencia rettgeri]
MNARVFAVNDANIQQVEAHFMALWSGGSSLLGYPLMWARQLKSTGTQ